MILWYFFVSSKIDKMEISSISQSLQIIWTQAGWGQKPSKKEKAEIRILKPTWETLQIPPNTENLLAEFIPS